MVICLMETFTQSWETDTSEKGTTGAQAQGSLDLEGVNLCAHNPFGKDTKRWPPACVCPDVCSAQGSLDLGGLRRKEVWFRMVICLIREAFTQSWRAETSEMGTDASRGVGTQATGHL